MAVVDLWFKGPRGKRVPSVRHGRGLRYRVVNTGPDGTALPTTSWTRKTDAEQEDARVRADMSRGMHVDPRAGKQLFGDWAAAWLSRQSFDETSRQTVESRLNTRILPVLGKLELLEIKASVIQAFVRKLQSDKLSPRYIDTLIQTVSTILAAAVDDEKIPRNPRRAKSVQLPALTKRKVVPWDAEQVAALARAMPEQYEAIVYVGYALGPRQGEAFGLDVDDVDFLRHTVHLRRQVRIVRNVLVFAPPKGDKERDVPLDDETAALLSAHVKLFPPQTVTLPWKVPDGKPVTARLLFTRAGAALHRSHFNTCVWVPALKAARLPPGRQNGYHKLRHTFASTMLAGGVDIRALAEYLGHENPGFTLRIYTHFMKKVDDRARAAMAAAMQILTRGLPDDHGEGVDAGQTG